MLQTELWGDVVRWGTTHKKDSWQECCAACEANAAAAGANELNCNVWVYCGDPNGCQTQYKECWLKHLVSAWCHLHLFSLSDAGSAKQARSHLL